jgi:hypothetical protein
MREDTEPAAHPPSKSTSLAGDLAHRTEISAGWYLKNPVVRALAQLVPGGVGGAIDAYVAGRYDRMLEDRRRAFFESLDEGAQQLTPEVLESDDFLHRFDITLRAVHRTHRQEKIRLFARLFKSSMVDAAGVTVDEYEELLRILDELSIKDLKVLAALEEYEKRHYREGRFATEDSFEGVFQRIAAEALGLPPDELSDDELRGVVVRLNRTGCYALMGWRHGPAKDCSLTGIYRRLKQLVADESGNLC